MSLSIEIRRIEGVVILELAGRLSVLERQLRHLARELIERGEKLFVINLANVAYLDSSGLGELCWIYTTLRGTGGDMKLLRPTERTKKLLSITKLDTVIESFDREIEAILALQPIKSAVSA